MIGRLLQTAATTFNRDGTTQRAQQQQKATQLESVTEEAHTRDLLYPDVVALRTSYHSGLPCHSGRVPATPREAANYDDRGGLDVTYPHDVRIIIAQDASARYASQILYDSRPARATTPQGREHRPEASQRQHARGKSMTSPQRLSGRGHQTRASTCDVRSPTSPLSPSHTRGLFSSATPTSSPSPEAESAQSRVKENKEETEALLGCMFGAPGLRLEPGTKIHVLPKTAQSSEAGPNRSRPLSPGGLLHQSRLPSPRVCSTPEVCKGQFPGTPVGSKPKTSIMITKLFTVQLLDPAVREEDDSSSAPNSPAQDPVGATATTASSKPQTVKQKKTPMYAVSIILQLPVDSFPQSRNSQHPGVTSLSSSYGSSAPTSPRFPMSNPGLSYIDNRVPGGLLSHEPTMSLHISYILVHWAILSRNLRLIEMTAQARLRHLLENAAPIIPTPVPSQGKAGNIKLRRPKPPSQQAVYVLGDCLQGDVQVRKQAEDSAANIAGGLRIRRVVPGQGRWGAWREEARWVTRWAGTREQNFFFFTFISAFLGQHTSWLEYVAPRWYRRRAAWQKVFGKDDSEALPIRTVIVCKDKMAARRLLFLAASFLPAPLQGSLPGLMQPQPPFALSSDSPSPLPMPREEYSKPAPARSSSAGAVSRTNPHRRSVSFSVGHLQEEPIEEESKSLGKELGRRASEARSISNTFAALPSAPQEARKASTSTLLADSALPVAHFSNVAFANTLKDSSQETERPGSNGSMASQALNSALKRSESITISSTGSIGGRFGSMMSGFWSSVTEPSTDGSTSDPALSSVEGTPYNRRLNLARGHSTSSARPLALHSATKLDQMVKEAALLSGSTPGDKVMPTGLLSKSPLSKPPLDLESCLKKVPSNSEGKSVGSVAAGADEDRLPLKLSMNEEDGFVDVAMPPGHSLTSSLTSSFASLRMNSLSYSNYYGSSSSAWMSLGVKSEHYSPYGSPTFVGSPPQKPETSPNVAGWLKSFHPDFTLQAVGPYEGLQTDVRIGLETEGRLSHARELDSDSRKDEWRNLCTILVADTTKFSINKVTLRRRKKCAQEVKGTSRSSEMSQATQLPASIADTPLPFTISPISSAASLYGTDMGMEEQIHTEPLMDIDPTLIDAIERVLAQSGPSSRAVSRAPSRAASRVPSRVPSRAPSPVRSRPVSVKSSDPQKFPQASTATKQEQVKRKGGIGAKQSESTLLGTSEDGSRITQQVPFSHCRKIILGALEEVVKSVIEERDLSDRGDEMSKGAGVTLPRAGTDGVLREGIGRWLSKVEEGTRR